jgi:hypothetical protein
MNLENHTNERNKNVTRLKKNSPGGNFVEVILYLQVYYNQQKLVIKEWYTHRHTHKYIPTHIQISAGNEYQVATHAVNLVVETKPST